MWYYHIRYNMWYILSKYHILLYHILQTYLQHEQGAMSHIQTCRITHMNASYPRVKTHPSNISWHTHEGFISPHIKGHITHASASPHNLHGEAYNTHTYTLLQFYMTHTWRIHVPTYKGSHHTCECFAPQLTRREREMYIYIYMYIYTYIHIHISYNLRCDVFICDILIFGYLCHKTL